MVDVPPALPASFGQRRVDWVREKMSKKNISNISRQNIKSERGENLENNID